MSLLAAATRGRRLRAAVNYMSRCIQFLTDGEVKHMIDYSVANVKKAYRREGRGWRAVTDRLLMQTAIRCQKMPLTVGHMTQCVSFRMTVSSLG